MKDMIDLGRVVSAPTLDELAKKLNMPAANLKKAVEDYNGVVPVHTRIRWASSPTTMADKPDD